MPNGTTKKNSPANNPPKLRVVAHNARLDQALQSEISSQLASVLKTNPKLSTQEAMWTVQEKILANNPWEPLKNGKCAINDLPNEILAYIFSIGVKEEQEGDSYFEDEEEEDEWEDMSVDDEFDDDETLGSSPLTGGSPMESDSDDDDSDMEEDDDDEPDIPFQVLVSHICKRWREVALDSHILWTTLDFETRPRLERARMYIARSGGLPLNIHIDCTFPENVDEEDHPDHPLYHENKTLREKSIHEALIAEHGEDYTAVVDEMYDGDDEDTEVSFLSQQELGQILDLIEPKVSQWGAFEFHASTYGYIHLLISRLHALPSAPLLETFEVYHIEDCDDYEVFNGDDKTSFLPFHGDAPLLKDVKFWGVHIDWDAALPSFLRGLHVFELSFHTKDVRPSYKTFRQIINNSPDLHTLGLSLSGPALGNDVPYDTDIEDGGWGLTPLTILSLRKLALQFHDLKYALALVKHLDVPNVTSLLLNFDEEDYSEFVDALLKPVKGRAENMLTHIEQMKILGLPCSVYSAEALLGQLGKLNSLSIKAMAFEESIIFQKLANPYAGRSLAGPPVTNANADAEVPQQQEPQAAMPRTTDLLPPTSTPTVSSSSPTPSLPTSNAPPLPALFCPRLEGIVTHHVPGMQIKKLLLARRKLGLPLKRVWMSQKDPISANEERWIRANVEEFEFFEPSDSEESGTDDDEDEDEGDDGGDDENGSGENEDENVDVDEGDGDENETPQTALFSPLARHLGRGRRGPNHHSMDLD